MPHEEHFSGSPGDYAITSRYPGDFEPVNEEEYKEALRLARMVVTWVENNI